MGYRAGLAATPDSRVRRQMGPGDWQKVKRVLQPALDLPPAQRPDYLDRACSGDPDLRREVEAYLDYEPEAGAALGVTAWRGDGEEQPADPERAGPYRILRRIAEGGMGVVYLAERDDGQYRRQVAVKVIKAGPQATSLMRRFRNERQILAEMDHPNIARLIDSGTTLDGQLYYVMDYVEGVPVTEYCHTNRLSVRRRAELFSAICQAVVYAHRKLIIHGDLKPANILVCADGTPKVVDFGLARVFHPSEKTGPAETSTALILTPAYASPEQIAGRRPALAADVYSLGVLLYELLTGAGPYDLSGKTTFEICQTVLEKEPRPPSVFARWRSGNGGEVPVAARQLAGDLDDIVLKALRKEPDQRYGSVDELRDEIERYLSGLPVRAARGKLLYRWRKFAKRRRWVLAASAAAALSAVIATVTIWREGRQAEMRFNDVRALAHSMIFELHDSIQGLPGSTAARKLLVEEALSYLRKLEASAGERYDLQLEMASAYQKIGQVQNDNSLGSLGDTSAALKSLENARRLLSGALAVAPNDSQAQLILRDVDLSLVDVHEARGEEGERAAASREAVKYAAILAHTYPDSRRFQASLLRITASNLAAEGNWEAALPAWKSAVAAYQAAVAEEPNSDHMRGQLAISLDGMAAACKQMGNWSCAIEDYRQAVAIRSSQLAATPANTRLSMLLSYHLIDLAWAEHCAGAQSQAIADEERALALQRGIAAADPENLTARLESAKTLVTRGLIYRDNGRLESAIGSLREAGGGFEALLERDPYNESTLSHLAWSSAELGEIYRSMALRRARGAGAYSDWRNAAACFERSSRSLERLKLGGKLLGIFDNRRLRADVPAKLAECRRHL